MQPQDLPPQGQEVYRGPSVQNQQMPPVVHQGEQKQNEYANFYPEQPKTRKKKRFGCGAIFCIFLVLILGTIGFVFIKNKIETSQAIKMVERFDTAPAQGSEEKVLEALNAGEITADELVMQMAYLMYEPSRMGESFRPDDALYTAPDIIEYLNTYGDELSDETLRYVGEKLFLVDYFSLQGTEQAQQEVPVSGASAFAGYPNVSAAIHTEETTNELLLTSDSGKRNNYQLSPNGTFVAWYSTAGDEAVSDEAALALLTRMEELVAKEAEISGIGWAYTPKAADMIPFRVDFGDDGAKVGAAFPVYLAELNDDNFEGALATYLNAFNIKEGLLLRIAKALNISPDGVLDTAYSWPYIVIRPSAMKNKEELDFILAHELFHHFQFVGGSTRESGGLTTETTANLAAAEATRPTRIDLVSNRHATTYIQNTHEAISRHTNGYSAFVWAKSYMDMVPNGWQHLFDSTSQKNAIEYLAQQAGSHYSSVTKDLAVRLLTKEYESKAYVSAEIPKPHAILEQNSQCSDTIAPSSIHYFYFGRQQNKKYNAVVGMAAEGAVSYCLLGLSKNGSYVLLQQGDLSSLVKVETMNPAYSGYKELVIGIINYDASADARYTISTQTSKVHKFLGDDNLAGLDVGELYTEFYFDELFDLIQELFKSLHLLGQTGVAEWDQQWNDTMTPIISESEEEFRQWRSKFKYSVLRVYMREFEMNKPAEQLHKDVKDVLNGIRFKVQEETLENGARRTIGAGYNLLNPKHVEVYILETYPDGTAALMLITLN